MMRDVWGRRVRRGLRSAFAIGMAMSCSACGSGNVAGPTATTERAAPPAPDLASSEVLSTTIGDAPTSTPREVPLVPGAAAPTNERPVPRDIVALSARLTPRPVPIPPTAAGMTERFTFHAASGDAFARGWFARVPGSSQPLLTPAYADGKVYLGGGFSSHQMFAYDARSGAPLFAASAPAGGPSSAVVEDDKVFFNTESCTLFAIDAMTGTQLWTRWLGDPLMSQPAAGDGVVFSGHVIDSRSPGRIRPGETGWGVGGGRAYGFTALRQGDGRPRWTTRIPADVMNAPVYSDRSVFFTTMDGTVHHLDARSGRVRWRRELRATSAPWLHGDELHVTVRGRGADGAPTREERALVLSTRRGETLRELDAVDAAFLRERADQGGVAAGWAYEGSRPTVVGERMYQTIGDEVHCRDAASGDLLWRRTYSETATTRPASTPAIAGSQLVFGTRDGMIFGLESDGGMSTFAYDVGEPIAAQPIVAHGWVYAATTRGGLIGLEVGDAALDGWHMWGGNAAHAGPTLGTSAPLEDESRPTEGTLVLGDEPNLGELGGFPLRSTRVHASVSGFVAHMRVEQTFDNPYERPVEASYLFPLPEDAIVDGMELHAGERVVRAQIARRRPIERDTDPSELAAILVQERADLFRQTVRNIEPSESVRVVLRYTQTLRFEDGSYRLTYPLVAGPRYTRAGEGDVNPPGTPLELELGADDRRPDRVEITVDADLGAGFAEVSSPTHALDVDRAPSDRRARVALASPEAPPDRDLELRFTVAGEEAAATLFASPPIEGEDGTFALALHPRAQTPPEALTPRELVFVIDTSTSMQGPAIERVQAAMRRALEGLRPEDAFRILVLDGAETTLGEDALLATPANVARARQLVGSLSRALPRHRRIAGEAPRTGREGLIAALEGDAGDRVRVVTLFSDGYIGHEGEVVDEVRARLGTARVHAFAVGTAINRYLLGQLSELGRGALSMVSLDEAPEAAAARFSVAIAEPYLTDLSIDWGDLATRDVYPRRLPDLSAERPLIVYGRFADGGDGRVVIRGRVAGRPFTQTIAVHLPRTGPARPELTSAWARTRIDDLMAAMTLSPSPALREEVTQLGLAHHMLTPWTAFEAVDPSYTHRRVAPREGEAAALPTERPAQNVSSPIPGCYATSRDDEGAIDPEALAECLAAAIAEP